MISEQRIEVEPFNPSRENLSDFAWRVIDDIFESGTDDEKESCIRAFYERVNIGGGVELVGISYEDLEGKFPNRMVLRRGGVDFIVYTDGSGFRYKLNGMPTRDADVAERIGAPVAFIEGLLLAVRFIGKHLGTKRQQEEELRKFDTERKKASAAKRALERAGNKGRPQVIKSLRRQVEKEIGKKGINCASQNAKQDHYKKIAERCASHSMPKVPSPNLRRSDIQRMEPFSGLYFEWDGLLCTYVGKSVNVPARVSSSHHKLTVDAAMSFIEMDSAVIGRNELFYIWLLNPIKNGGLD